MAQPFNGNYRVTQSFGIKNAALTGGVHRGVDWACPPLTQVRAISSGKIIGVSTSPTAGLFITQQSGIYIIRYLHLSKSLVKVGDIVSAGQYIALSGNTGLSTGPHLHIDVQNGGIFIDPMQLINNNDVTPSPNTNTNSNNGTYSIRSGDTLYALETAWGIPHGTLQQLNPDVTPTKLRIGQLIKTPHATSSVPAPAARYYTIKKGDTFWDIENNMQLKHGTLQQLNPSVNPRTLQVNQQIRVA